MVYLQWAASIFLWKYSIFELMLLNFKNWNIFYKIKDQINFFSIHCITHSNFPIYKISNINAQGTHSQRRAVCGVLQQNGNDQHGSSSTKLARLKAGRTDGRTQYWGWFIVQTRTRKWKEPATLQQFSLHGVHEISITYITIYCIRHRVFGGRVLNCRQPAPCSPPWAKLLAHFNLGFFFHQKIPSLRGE